MSVDPRVRDRVEESFRRAFDRAPTLVVASPGRVNLIGEHTDYNDGFVMPCAIDRHTLIALAPADHGEGRVVAADYNDEIDRFALRAPIAHSTTSRWANYVRGCVDQLAASGFVAGGFDMAIAGDIPQGTGLSSSASLEVGVVTALSHQFGWGIAPTDAALIAQAAENRFVGMACGIPRRTRSWRRATSAPGPARGATVGTRRRQTR
ncbi:hypothetical protein J4558_21330 [Leptolyngbya sp. 15MV]|nr:hypothetical protein J4558_21330 [Leptolyngbya sp. 15MV]